MKNLIVCALFGLMSSSVFASNGTEPKDSSLNRIAEDEAMDEGVLEQNAEQFFSQLADARHGVQDFGGNLNLDVGIDVLGIAQHIRQLQHSEAEAGAQVKNILNHIDFTMNQLGVRNNVMIFSLQNNYSENLQNVKFYGSTTIDDRVFGIWIFERGEFENQGSMGWQNWGFMGNFERQGDKGRHVVFY